MYAIINWSHCTRPTRVSTCTKGLRRKAEVRLKGSGLANVSAAGASGCRKYCRITRNVAGTRGGNR